MSATNLITFRGHISWDGQMNGLPPVIESYLIVEGYYREKYVEIIEAQSSRYISNGGMSVSKDAGQIVDMRSLNNDTMFVPMQWIVFLDFSITPLTGEVSGRDEDGVERFKDGTEPLKQ